MANSFITAQWVGRKALTILHAKASAAARTNRNYQNEFTPIQGVPRGTTINVRVPFRYTLRTGPTMSAQNSTQRYVPLTLNNQNGVDINFSSIERAMDLGDFAEQVLEPAMAQVAAGIEANITSLYTQIPKQVGSFNLPVSFQTLIQARQFLTQALAPDDGQNRTILVDPVHNYDWILNNSTLYNPNVEIADQWISGIIASKVANFMAIENTKISGFTSGATTGTALTASYVSGGSTGVGNAYTSTVTIAVSGTTYANDVYAVGDVLTISNVYDVDPETGNTLGRLKQFVVATATAATANSDPVAGVQLYPGLILSGAYKNVVGANNTNIAALASINGATLTLFCAASASQSFRQSIAFYRDAVLFACVPMLDVSDTVKMCAAESFDGFNIRFIQVYDANNDLLPGRLDTLSGEVLAYPELAVRVAGT